MLKVINLLFYFSIAGKLENLSNDPCSKYLNFLMAQPGIQNYVKLWLCQLIAEDRKNTGGHPRLPTPLSFE